MFICQWSTFKGSILAAPVSGIVSFHVLHGDNIAIKNATQDDINQQHTLLCPIVDDSVVTWWMEPWNMVAKASILMVILA